MATDNEQLVLSISADVRQIQRQMKSLVGQTQRDTKAIENAFSGIDKTASGAFAGVAANSNKAFTSAEQASKKFGAALKTSSAQTTNMAYQLQDIGVQLAGGQSPFLIGIQQLSQMNLGAMGVRGTLSAIGGAASTILSPMNAIGLAVIALVGYSVQYFSEWLSSGKATSAEIEKQAALVQKVADKYGVAIPALREYADELERAADAADRMEALKATRTNVQSNFGDVFKGVTKEITGIIGLIPDANREFGVLASKIDSNSQTADDFQRVITELNKAFEATGSQAVRSAIVALENLQATSQNTSAKLKDIDSNLTTVNLSMEQGKSLAAALTSQMLGLGTQGAGAIKQIADAVGSYLGPAMRNASGLLDTLGKTYDEVSKSQSSAAGMLRNFESFSPKAYWDVNAYRTGFGSDTTTRADGSIEKVTKETTVTLADAERDLSRRITEFQTGIQKAIGIDTWRSLSEEQQAALTSIAYNYGSLPDSIVKAIEGGGGPEKVASAIAALTANPGRRKQEAQSYLTGTGISMSEAGLTDKKSPEDLFKGDVGQVQKRIDLLNAEYSAQAKLNPLIDDYGYAVEKARIQQQLLSDAQKAGINVTPEIAASIETLAENYARASAASDQLKDSQQQTVQSAGEFRSLGRDITGGFIDDLRSGKSAADALANALDKVVDKLLDMALNSVFGIGVKGGGLGGGGLLGGAIIPGILHSGGVAGSDGYGHGRSVSPSTFSDAKRYHTGGIAGLQPGEVPAILQRGELVLPRGSKIGSGSGGYAPTYNIDARGADQAAVARMERGLQERDRTESKRVSGRMHQQNSRKIRP
jgi:GH24 family phage-related lysozyme (muramidase)